MIIRTLRVLGWIVGSCLVGLGVGRILFPVATIPGATAMNATVDSETRAGGALLIALGVGYLWAVRRSPIPATLLRFLALGMGLLALTRVVSIVATGVPHPIFVVAMVVEIVASVLTFWYSTLRDVPEPVGR
ncbi:DUF4345 domain-containing protein [Mycolicibacterium sp.]|uniref:DUF4345 domain-containing protein n=1 Tax=Mycolicibacterium sp. TaxID=2320850 RepID=UPI0037CA1994